VVVFVVTMTICWKITERTMWTFLLLPPNIDVLLSACIRGVLPVTYVLAAAGAAMEDSAHEFRKQV